MNELTYEDVDEDGDPWGPTRSKRPKWQTEPVGQPDLLQKIFELYYMPSRRKYFASADEAKAWKKICKQLDKGMNIQWVHSCMDWVKARIDSGGFIPFWTLENLILNPVRYREWLAKNKMAQHESNEDIVFNPGGDGDIGGR